MEDAEELEERRADLEQLLYNLKIEINRLVGTKKESPSPTVSGVTSMSGIQLQRIKVPMFDGDILNWSIF